MKKLTKEQMKMVMGGDDPYDNPEGPGGGEASPCEGKSPGDACTANSGPCSGAHGTCSTHLKCAVAC